MKGILGHKFVAWKEELRSNRYDKCVIFHKINGNYPLELLIRDAKDDKTLLIGLSHTKKLNQDVTVSAKSEKPNNGKWFQLDHSAFSYQYNFWRRNKTLGSWKEKKGLFHLGHEIIGAVHLAILVGITKIDIVNTETNNFINKLFDKKILIQFFSTISKDVEIRYSEDDPLFNDILSLNKVDEWKKLAPNRNTIIPNRNVKYSTDPRVHEANEIFANFYVPFDFSKISSCAIVGNSGKMNRYENGEFIDSHDCVVRMNSAPTEGHQKHVGSKTTFRFINGMLLKGADLWYTETPKDWLSTVRDERIIFGLTTLGGNLYGLNQSLNTNEIYLLSDSAIQYLKQFEREHGINHLSMGLVTILIFTRLADVVNVFGFGFNMEKSLDQKHYWETFSDDHDGGHSWGREKELILGMHEQGHITIQDKD